VSTLHAARDRVGRGFTPRHGGPLKLALRLTAHVSDKIVSSRSSSNTLVTGVLIDLLGNSRIAHEIPRGTELAPCGRVITRPRRLLTLE
jgi:hypothetical protein